MNTKKLLLTRSASILILTLFSFQACSESTSETVEAAKFENSKHKLDVKDAEKMQRLYLENQYRIINSRLSANQQKDSLDYREYWFPLEELKHYISYIEHKADSLNYDRQTLGIRIYNAAKLEEHKSIKSSVFLIGTHQTTDDDASKAGFMSTFNASLNPSNENIKSISAFNYGNSGMPPKQF